MRKAAWARWRGIARPLVALVASACIATATIQIFGSEDLEILSEIAEMLSDRGFRERLMAEPDAAELHRLIAGWEPLKSVA